MLLRGRGCGTLKTASFKNLASASCLAEIVRGYSVKSDPSAPSAGPSPSSRTHLTESTQGPKDFDFFEKPSQEYVQAYKELLSPRTGADRAVESCAPVSAHRLRETSASLPLSEGQVALLRNLRAIERQRRRNKFSIHDHKCNDPRSLHPSTSKAHPAAPLLEYTHWLVEHSKAQHINSSGEGSGAQGKGKARKIDAKKERVDEASRLDFSVPIWGVLLQNAASHRDGRTFVKVLQSAGRWWDNVILQKLEHVYQTALRSLEEPVLDLRKSADESADSTSKSTVLDAAGGSKLPHTMSELEQLAVRLAWKLKSGRNLPTLRIKQLAARSHLFARLCAQLDPSVRDFLALKRPDVITDLLREKLPVPRNRSSILEGDAKSQSTDAKRHRPWSLQRRIRMIALADCDREARCQLRDFMAILRERADQNLGLGALETRIQQRWRTCSSRNVQEMKDSSISKSGIGSRSLRRPLQKVTGLSHEVASSLQPDPDVSDSKPFPLLGHIRDKSSLMSLLVRRHRTADAVIVHWLCSWRGGAVTGRALAGWRGQEPGMKQSVGSGVSALRPPIWLLVVAVKALAERGDTAKVESTIRAYLSAYAETCPLTDEGWRSHRRAYELWESNTAGRRRVRPPQSLHFKMTQIIAFHPGARSLYKTSKLAEEQVDGSSLLNYLVCAHHVAVVDAQSGRSELHKAWSACIELCGDRAIRTGRAKEAQASLSHAPSMLPSVRPLPLLTPDEFTVIYLLKLLRFDSGRVRRGLELVKRIEETWGPIEVVRIVPNASDAFSKQDVTVVPKVGPEARRPSRYATRITIRNPPTFLTVRTASLLLQWAYETRKLRYVDEIVEMAERWRRQERSRRLRFDVERTQAAIEDERRRIDAEIQTHAQSGSEEGKTAVLAQYKEDLRRVRLWHDRVTARVASDNRRVHRYYRRPARVIGKYSTMLDRVRRRLLDKSAAHRPAGKSATLETST